MKRERRTGDNLRVTFVYTALHTMVYLKANFLETSQKQETMWKRKKKWISRFYHILFAHLQGTIVGKIPCRKRQAEWEITPTQTRVSNSKANNARKQKKNSLQPVWQSLNQAKDLLPVTPSSDRKAPPPPAARSGGYIGILGRFKKAHPSSEWRSWRRRGGARSRQWPARRRSPPAPSAAASGRGARPRRLRRGRRRRALSSRTPSEFLQFASRRGMIQISGVTNQLSILFPLRNCCFFSKVFN